MKGRETEENSRKGEWCPISESPSSDCSPGLCTGHSMGWDMPLASCGSAVWAVILPSSSRRTAQAIPVLGRRINNALADTQQRYLYVILMSVELEFKCCFSSTHLPILWNRWGIVQSGPLKECSYVILEVFSSFDDSELLSCKSEWNFFLQSGKVVCMNS